MITGNTLHVKPAELSPPYIGGVAAEVTVSRGSDQGERAVIEQRTIAGERLARAPTHRRAVGRHREWVVAIRTTPNHPLDKAYAAHSEFREGLRRTHTRDPDQVPASSPSQG